MTGVEVSVVLPAYNEEATIEHTVETTLETLGVFCDSFEVIVAEDGCDDRTVRRGDRLPADAGQQAEP